MRTTTAYTNFLDFQEKRDYLLYTTVCKIMFKIFRIRPDTNNGK